MQARSGRIDDARATLDGLRDEGFPIRQIYPWSVAVTDLAEAAEVAGDPDVAAHVLAVAAPYAGRIAVSGPYPNRPFDQALAQAALAVGDVGAAEALRRAEPSPRAASARRRCSSRASSSSSPRRAAVPAPPRRSCGRSSARR